MQGVSKKDLAERRNSECWEWTGTIERGYGKFAIKGVSKRVHRVVYEAFFGPVPEGLVLDHLCRNRKCANPWHLEAVTSQENILRGTGASARNAVKTHCSRGHKFNSKHARYSKKGRYCRTCQTQLQKEARIRKRTAIAAVKGVGDKL